MLLRCSLAESCLLLMLGVLSYEDWRYCMITMIDRSDCNIEIHDGIIQGLTGIKLEKCRLNISPGRFTIPWFIPIFFRIKSDIRKAIE